MTTRELDLIRKFLDQNNLYAIAEILKERCDRVHGAKLFDSIQVNKDEDTTAIFRHSEWDSDGYFASAHPSRLTVPPGLGGRYFVQVAVRWRNPDSPAPPGIENSHYYAYLTLNGSQRAAWNDARSTARSVMGMGFSTTQHFTLETNLAAGDYVGLCLRQNIEEWRTAEVYLQMRRIGC